MVKIYDNLGQTCDRYIVEFEEGELYTMSDNADQPNGVCMYMGKISDYENDFGIEVAMDCVPNSVLKQISRILLSD